MKNTSGLRSIDPAQQIGTREGIPNLGAIVSFAYLGGLRLAKPPLRPPRLLLEASAAQIADPDIEPGHRARLARLQEQATATHQSIQPESHPTTYWRAFEGYRHGFWVEKMASAQPFSSSPRRPRGRC